MHRPTIGIIALVLIVLAATLTFSPLSSASWDPWGAAFWRVGSIMAVLWVAHPQLRRVPSWAFVPGCFLLLLIAWKPKILILGVVAIIAYAILRPRTKIAKRFSERAAGERPRSSP